jgi:hypothetical protein
MIRLLTPYEEGFVAGTIGLAILSNPHRRWGFGWVKWRSGYIAGRF